MVRESVYMQMVLVLMHTWCTHLTLVLMHYMACTMAKNLFTFFYMSSLLRDNTMARIYMGVAR